MPVGSVRDAHRRVGLVDVLAAGAGGAEGVDAQVGRIDVDFDGVVDFGIDEHAGKRGVAAVVGVERRLAHQAVHAGFGAQMAVGVVAADLERGALDAGDFARRFFEQLDLEALALAVAQVHALEHRGPVLRLGAAGAGLDVEKAVVRVHRVGEHAAELQVRDGFSRGRAASCGDRWSAWRRRCSARAMSNSSLASRSSLVELRQGADHGFERFAFAAEVLRALAVAPDGGVFGQPDDFFEALLLGVEVKDTSAVPQRGFRGPAGAWRWR